MFLAAMRDKSKKEDWEHSAHSHGTTDGMDAWYMLQRNREKELKQRRQEAEQLLRGYRGQYISDGFSPAFSPRRERPGRASFSHTLSDSLIDPQTTEKRRQSTMPRIQSHFGEDSMEARNDKFGKRLGPERTDFLNDRRQYDGTQYDAFDETSFENEKRFRESNERSSNPESREPEVSMDHARLIDISASHGRLSEVSGRRSLGDVSGRSGRRSHVSTDSYHTDREQALMPETVWREFISPGKFSNVGFVAPGVFCITFPFPYSYFV